MIVIECDDKKTQSGHVHFCCEVQPVPVHLKVEHTLEWGQQDCNVRVDKTDIDKPSKAQIS